MQSALPEPFGWLAPALAAAGLPVLDPRFAALLGPLTGPRPRVGAPPFLGPLVRKLVAARAAGLLDAAALPAPARRRLFALLASHPPRDLAPPEVALLRSLPLYERLPAPRRPPPPLCGGEQQEQDEGGSGGSGSGSGSGSASTSSGGNELGGEGSGEAESDGGELVALAGRDDWLLVPDRCLERLGSGVVALLPPAAYARLLRHAAAGGELYHTLGLEPASPARLLADALLPAMPAMPEAGAARLLDFVAAEWGRMKVRCLFASWAGGDGAERQGRAVCLVSLLVIIIRLQYCTPLPASATTVSTQKHTVSGRRQPRARRRGAVRGAVCRRARRRAPAAAGALRPAAAAVPGGTAAAGGARARGRRWRRSRRRWRRGRGRQRRRRDRRRGRAVPGAAV